MCIYLFFGVIFNGNNTKMFPAICLTFFFVAFWMARKEQSIARDISLFFLMTLNIVLVFIFSERLATTAGTILYIIMIPVSVLLGSWTQKKKLMIIYFIVFIFFISYAARPNLIHYYRNTDAFQNKKLPEIAFHSLNQEQINFDTEVTVVDLWSTTCGVCFEEFPIYEKLKQEFEGNSKIKFYSANVPIKRDTREKTLGIIKELNYDYETVFAEKFEMIRDSLGINGFPHLLIVKNDTIRYLGDMETDRKIVLTNTRNVIKNILE